MKQLLFFFLFCSGISSINAQLGMAINADASQPHASALLDMFKHKGLPPLPG